MTQLLYYSGLTVAALAMAYLALDMAVWILYWVVNLF
jgi:hypothetical protein